MTEHQASRAEHQGTQQAPRCHIYNCLEEGTHIVGLPASTDERLSPSARRAATVRLCPPCLSDWMEHTDFARLRQNIDLVRARPPTDERNAVAVPRDKDAKALVEAIHEQTCVTFYETMPTLGIRLSVIQGDAERLAVLLAERDAEREELVTALEFMLAWTKPLPGPDSPAEKDARAALARVKGAPNG